MSKQQQLKDAERRLKNGDYSAVKDILTIRAQMGDGQSGYLLGVKYGKQK